MAEPLVLALSRAGHCSPTAREARSSDATASNSAGNRGWYAMGTRAYCSRSMSMDQ